MAALPAAAAEDGAAAATVLPHLQASVPFRLQTAVQLQTPARPEGRAAPKLWQQRWRALLSRIEDERASNRSKAAPCETNFLARCPDADWRALLERVRSQDRWRQMVAVNRFVNGFGYVADADNWGVSDYWATPEEFFQRSGDCEDFAIAKYASLRQLGWKDSELRLTIVRDLDRAINHAVLMVAWNQQWWLLDNQVREIVREGAVPSYRRLYALDEAEAAGPGPVAQVAADDATVSGASEGGGWNHRGRVLTTDTTSASPDEGSSLPE